MADVVVKGDTSGAVTLSAPAVAGTVTVTLPATSGTMAVLPTATGVLTEAAGGTGTTTGYYGFKNRLINGSMVIDQRNAGASVTPTNLGYTLDRWTTILSQASKVTLQQNQGSVTPPSGFSNYLGITVGASANVTVGASDYFAVRQFVEGFNFFDCDFGKATAKTVTVSFWVRSSVTGTYYGSLLNNSTNRGYPFSYSISSANTWEQKTATIAGDTSGTWEGATNATGVQVCFSLGFGSNFYGTANAWNASSAYSASGETRLITTNSATFYITGVQLEKGSTATSFDYRPYGTEMSLCQRYYWRLGGSQFGGAYMPMVLFTGTASTSAAATIQLPVRARTPPTSITLGGSAPSISAGTITTNLTLDRNSYDGVMVYISGTGFALGTSYRWIGNADATTFLGFEGMEL